MTVPAGENTATLVIPSETDPPADVISEWIHVALRGLPTPARQRATVIAHELVSAARTRRAAPYVVRLAVLDRCRALAVSVDDTADGPSSADSNLVLVAGLATCWGVEQRRGGRTVWAELDVDAAEVCLAMPDQPLPRSGDQRLR